MRSLIYDLNGNYVIFKMLETYDKLKMEFLIPIVEESVYIIIIKNSLAIWANKYTAVKLYIKLYNNTHHNK